MDQHTHPAAERLFPVALLTLSGGLQDAYTYLRRGKVFANAQTGNIVLLGQSLFDGDWSRAARYLLPVLAFALGVAAAEFLRLRPSRLHWQRRVLLWEIFLLFLVGFIPHSLDQLANALVSFSCAMQVQAFRKMEGVPFASTMCIGNLRSGIAHLSAALCHPDRRRLWEAGKYGGIILLFGLGAGLGSVLTPYLGLGTIWISCALLGVDFLLMLGPKGDSSR